MWLCEPTLISFVLCELEGLSCVNRNAFHLFCVKQHGIQVDSDPSQSVAVLVKWVY